MLRIYYKHTNCKVEPGVAWQDRWSSAVTADCPACGTKDIEPYDWEKVPPFPLNTLTREECVKVLEAVSIQSYDHEPVAELIEAVEANFDDGTIDEAALASLRE
jgi:hypothetical protein